MKMAVPVLLPRSTRDGQMPEGMYALSDERGDRNHRRIERGCQCLPRIFMGTLRDRQIFCAAGGLFVQTRFFVQSPRNLNILRVVALPTTRASSDPAHVRDGSDACPERPRDPSNCATSAVLLSEAP
jgi:hypothetical protein